MLMGQVDNAIGLIDAIRPAWTDVQRERFLAIATADAVKKGLVGIHDARAPVADLAFYKRWVSASSVLCDPAHFA